MAPFEELHKVVGWCMLSGGGAWGGGALSMGNQASTQRILPAPSTRSGEGLLPLRKNRHSVAPADHRR